MPLKNRFAELQEEISEWRQDFHAHPEILFETHRTSKIVEQKLESFGCDSVIFGLGRTGVVGIIHGRENTKDSVIGLRADMDALPIEETTGLSYSSNIKGAMHACGRMRGESCAGGARGRDWSDACTHAEGVTRERREGSWRATNSACRKVLIYSLLIHADSGLCT